jgi:DNA-directed RNA polymerase alpha subunit
MQEIPLRVVFVEGREGRFFLSATGDNLPERALNLKTSLLSALPGRGVAGIAADGVHDLFDRIGGVEEDLSDIMLALGRVSFWATDAAPEIVSFSGTGPNEVTAGDVFGKRIADKAHVVLFHIREGESASIRFFLRSAKGYVSADENARQGLPDDFLPSSSVCTPVRRADVTVTEDPGNDMAGIEVHIVTSGAIDPESAIRLALGEAGWGSTPQVREEM